MIKQILTYCFVLTASFIYSQEVNISFTFTDEASDFTLDTVAVSIYDSSNKSLFNRSIIKGETVGIEPTSDLKIRVNVTAAYYQQLDTLIDLNPFRNLIKRGKLIPLNLVLKYDGQVTGNVEIYGYYEPEVAFSSERISVSDYVVYGEDSLLILAYPKRLGVSNELLWYVRDTVVSRREGGPSAKRLIRDYRNRVYLRFEDKDYFIEDFDNLDLVLVDRAQLKTYVQPILDTLDNKGMFFTNYNELYPAYDYYQIDLSDTTESVLHHIEDKEMMEHYRAEYKWADVRTKLWAWEMEDETGIDRQTWVGANVFTRSIYYEKPYGNFFLKDSIAYVFDFYQDHLFKYNGESKILIDSVAISFHKDGRKPKWTKKLIQDPVTKKAYTYFDDAGYTDVYEIDLASGKLLDKYTLFNRYVENIQVYNNEIYYIYRPFESMQKKYLYKEDLNDKDRNLKGQNRFNK